ncbi:MAG TPA: hypothetical protein GX521_03675 [Firmicutes bacterium]|nr:hypothetical protein [Bacillota bacterium]
MRKAHILAAVILLLVVSGQVVQAGTFYKHDHPDYWWYVVGKPAFSVVVPSTPDNPKTAAETKIYVSRSVFGAEILEIVFAEGLATMEVVHQPGKDIQAVKASLDALYKPLLKNIVVTDNKEITTSKNVKAHFYAFKATGAHKKEVMFRSVFFQRGEHIVYLTILLDADQYSGDVPQYWLRAVNEFEWN